MAKKRKGKSNSSSRNERLNKRLHEASVKRSTDGLASIEGAKSSGKRWTEWESLVPPGKASDLEKVKVTGKDPIEGLRFEFSEIEIDKEDKGFSWPEEGSTEKVEIKELLPKDAKFEVEDWDPAKFALDSSEVWSNAEEEIDRESASEIRSDFWKSLEEINSDRYGKKGFFDKWDAFHAGNLSLGEFQWLLRKLLAALLVVVGIVMILDGIAILELDSQYEEVMDELVPTFTEISDTWGE